MNCVTARSTPASSSVCTWIEPNESGRILADQLLGEDAHRRDHEEVDGREAEAVVQPARIGVSEQHLQADVVEPSFACRLEHLRQQGAADPFVPRARANVEVGDVRGLTATIAEDAEDEPDGTPFLLGEHGDSLAHGLQEVRPRLVPGLEQIRGTAELLLELLPELADDFAVFLGGGADRHR